MNYHLLYHFVQLYKIHGLVQREGQQRNLDSAFDLDYAPFSGNFLML